MEMTTGDFLGLAAIISALALFMNWRKRRMRLSIFGIERNMRISEPVPLSGTPDIVWLRGDGKLIVGDYKSRPNCRVQQSDIIQLSVYRLLLMHTQHRPVADIGYIQFEKGKRTKTKLLKEQEIISLYWRYLDIISGDKKGKKFRRKAYCQYCSHQQRCQ